MKSFILSALILLIVGSGAAYAQTSSFTYQGKLTDGGSNANGPYDFIFRLFTTGGTQVGTDVTVDDVQVTAGVFTVNLNFGSSPFTSVTGNFLEISVRPGASTGAFTPLSPRQPITSSPYAVQTIRAASAAVADNTSQLGGVPAAQFVQTGDSRLSDDRNPTAGSGNYIQNTTATQATSNFNISGTGAANIFNATTQYHIGGNRVLTSGLNNLYVGTAGVVAASGDNNTFVGNSAGSSNTLGSNNTLLGFNSNVLSNNLSFATAIGSGAIVSSNNSVVLGRGLDTVQIPGALNVTGATTFGGTLGANIFNAATQYNIGGNRVLSTFGAFNTFVGQNTGTSNTGGNNVFVGFSSGSGNTSGSGNAFFGSQSGQNSTTGSNNSFFGESAGFANTAGSNNNSFFGQSAGRSNSASDNAFFGTLAGADNFSGANNSFFGSNAGRMNSLGIGNAFFGTATGFSNTTGNTNAFFGTNAGQSNTTGSNNAFFGTLGGGSNTTGTRNSFFGDLAGFPNTTGSDNAFFGAGAGSSNTTGSKNTVVGNGANVGSGNLTNATAIGANSAVSQNNSLVLGSINGVNGAISDSNVGIGTTAPQQILHANGTTEILSTGNGAGFKFRDRGSTSSADDWVLYSNGNIARFFRAGVGDLMTLRTNGNVGIGTTNPNTKLQVAGGSVYIQNPNSLIITSPNGACWFITVSNAGALATNPVACP